MATTRNEQHEGADGEDELTRSAAREGPESVQAAQFAKMLVPGLGPYRVVAEFVEFVPVQVELAPCGPRASTTRPTSTTTSPPASATTGRDSTGCLRALRKGDVLVVWKLDRLGRNLAHLVNTVQDLSARGVGLRVLTGQGAQIDTTTAAGRLVFGIFEALAEFERELIRERTVAGLKGRASSRTQGRRQEVRAVESPSAAGPGRDGAPRHVGVRTVPRTRNQAGGRSTGTSDRRASCASRARRSSPPELEPLDRNAGSASA